LRLDLAHFLAAGAEIINPARTDDRDFPDPPDDLSIQMDPFESSGDASLLLVEIPDDYLTLKSKNADLALRWRLHSRSLFENLFNRGYLVTDFVHLAGRHARSYYVLSHGESTL
jgi:predicted GNAT superfamily acetyltransferase